MKYFILWLFVLNLIFLIKAYKINSYSSFPSMISPKLSTQNQFMSRYSSQTDANLDILSELHSNSKISSLLCRLPQINFIFDDTIDFLMNDFIFYIPNKSKFPYSELSQDEYYFKIINRLEFFLFRFSKKINSTISDTLIDAGEWSHFLSLTYPSIDEALPNLSELRLGIDAFELRVDLLKDHSPISIHRQITLLRDFCPLPIVYTVRTKGQLGNFDLEPSKPIIELLKEGLKAGVEWLDVEACLPIEDIKEIAELVKTKYNQTTKILGSLHNVNVQSRESLEKMFESCDLFGQADILKVVTGAANEKDCQLIHEVGNSNVFGKPYIGLCLGPEGANSRVLNRRFTPVTHKLMSAAAPGQMTVEELMTARLEQNLIKPKQFYLFGNPIQQSQSPAMHNRAFKTLLLPHIYSLFESNDIEIYNEVLNNKSTGGISVTIPHKETIIPYLDELRDAAKAIGSYKIAKRRELIKF